MGVLNDVVGGAKDVAGTVGKAAGQVLSLSKLKLKSVQLNSDVRSLYEKLGNMVYTSSKDGENNDEIISSLCERIDGVLLELTKINEKMCEIQNIQICEHCNTKVSADFVYCFKCGNKLQKEDEFVADNIEFTDVDNSHEKDFNETND